MLARVVKACSVVANGCLQARSKLLYSTKATVRITAVGQLVNDTTQFDEFKAVQELHSAVVNEKAQFGDIQTVFKGGLVDSFLDRYREVEHDLLATKTKWGDAQTSTIKLYERTGKQIGTLTKSLHKLEKKYDQHIRRYKRNIIRFQKESGKTLVRVLFETFATELLRDHLGGRHSGATCGTFLAELETAGVIRNKHVKSLEGSDTYELLNKQFSKAQVLRHAVTCETPEVGFLLQTEALTPEGVPLITKRRADLAPHVEAMAKVFWDESHMAHHLLDPSSEEIVLWRGERTDEANLFLSSVMKYLDLAHIVKLPIERDVSVEAAEDYDRAVADITEHRQDMAEMGKTNATFWPDLPEE